jgi:hypothetical protein
MTRPSPPSGAPPPQVVRLDDGSVVALGPLVELVAERYYDAYPDEDERYGPAGREWCIHDNLYLLAWAYGARRGDVRFEEQVLWLARVLHSRGFPLERLAHDLRIAADVVVDVRVVDAEAVAGILREGGEAVVRYAGGLAAD